MISKILDPYTWTSKQNIEELAKSLKMGSTILDVGSGGQWARDLFEKYNHKYMGCDIEESINADIQDFFVVDEQLPLLDNSIDALISNSVLEHLRDPQAALSEYHRVLKPNGILYIQTNFLYQEHGNPHDYLRFTLEMLRYLTTTNGFTVLESSKIGSRFALIIDNASANYANRMSKILQFFFQFDSIKRLLLLLPFLLFTIITTVIGTVTFLGLVVLRIYGNLPRFRNHAFYPGVFVKAKK